MSDPVAEQLTNLELRLHVCQQERTAQAKYAVELENELHSTQQEKFKLITAMNHLLEHLEHHPLTHSCEETHPIVKEYKFNG